MMLDDLRDDELINLHKVFLQMARRDIAKPQGRSIAAVLNEVDERLSKRGLLDLSTGVLRDG
jgi:hypothetical protein